MYKLEFGSTRKKYFIPKGGF